MPALKTSSSYKDIQRQISAPIICNLTPFLPGLLSIKGKSLTLDNHFVFKPLFDTKIRTRTVLHAGRQIGKSISLTALLLLRAACFTHHNSLVVLPLQEQADRLSVQYFKPMIEDSPIKALLRDDERSGSIRRRSFTNRSMITFLYAWLDAERVRGNPADCLAIDEAQDMDSAHMAVLQSCLDASENPETIISGTSKTNDTMLERQWLNSSQGVYQITCPSCAFVNIAIRKDGHVDDMIGDYSDDISEERPGVVCAKCRKPVSPRYHGQWVHRYPERERELPGYHLPQILFPTHYAKPKKWKILLERRANYNPGKFSNEVLGEAYDFAVKLVSEEDLVRIALLHENTLANALEAAFNYNFRILSVDWGGGGEEGGSCTKIAVLGYAHDGRVDVIYGKQFPASTDHVNEVKFVIDVAQKLNCDFIVHDYNGGGVTRESILTHGGWPLSRILPIVYCYDPEGPVIKFVHPKKERTRGFYHLDKSRSLQYNCFAIRGGLVRTFKYDYVNEENRGMLIDFTSLVENPVESPTGITYYRVQKSSTATSDDFANAVNMGLSVMWEFQCQGQWPNLLGG